MGVDEDDKYWPPVARIDNVYGDRHLQCGCPPLTAYAAQSEARASGGDTRSGSSRWPFRDRDGEPRRTSWQPDDDGGRKAGE